MSAARQAGGDPDRREAAVRHLTQREARALTEPLVAVDDRGAVQNAPGLAHIYAADGTRYLVDLEYGGCQCPDSTYRDGVTCKHVVVGRLWTGRRPLPDGIDESAVDGNTLRAAREHESKDGER
jgi:hypothetical protein